MTGRKMMPWEREPWHGAAIPDPPRLWPLFVCLAAPSAVMFAYVFRAWL